MRILLEQGYTAHIALLAATKDYGEDARVLLIGVAYTISVSRLLTYLLTYTYIYIYNAQKRNGVVLSMYT